MDDTTFNEKGEEQPTKPEEPKSDDSAIEIWFDKFIDKLRLSKHNTLLLILAFSFTFTLVAAIYSVSISYSSQTEVLETKFSERLAVVEKNTERIALLESQVKTLQSAETNRNRSFEAFQSQISNRFRPFEEFQERQITYNLQNDEKIFRIENRLIGQRNGY